MPQWYCALTSYNAEYEAQKQLRQQGMPTFLPSYLIKWRSGNIRPRLLFHGYIFVGLEDPRDWPRVENTFGILQVLKFTPDTEGAYQMPSHCASEQIDQLRACALSYDQIDRRRPEREQRPIDLITEGCFVRVKEGIFKAEPYAQRALVEWADNSRAKLVLQMFNRTVRVEFFHKDLEIIDAAR